MASLDWMHQVMYTHYLVSPSIFLCIAELRTPLCGIKWQHKVIDDCSKLGFSLWMLCRMLPRQEAPMLSCKLCLLCGIPFWLGYRQRCRWMVYVGFGTLCTSVHFIHAYVIDSSIYHFWLWRSVVARFKCYNQWHTQKSLSSWCVSLSMLGTSTPCAKIKNNKYNKE